MPRCLCCRSGFTVESVPTIAVAAAPAAGASFSPPPPPAATPAAAGGGGGGGGLISGMAGGGLGVLAIVALFGYNRAKRKHKRAQTYHASPAPERGTPTQSLASQWSLGALLHSSHYSTPRLGRALPLPMNEQPNLQLRSV